MAEDNGDYYAGHKMYENTDDIINDGYTVYAKVCRVYLLTSYNNNGYYSSIVCTDCLSYKNEGMMYTRVGNGTSYIDYVGNHQTDASETGRTLAILTVGAI